MVDYKRKIKHQRLIRAIAFTLVIVFGLQSALWAAPDTLRSVRDIEKPPIADGKDDKIDPGLFRYLCSLPGIGRKTFSKGTEIFKQGEEPDKLYIIISGEAQVLQYLPNGQVRDIPPLGPGDCFGEMALLTGLPRTASVVATEDTKVLLIDKKQLSEICKGRPELASYLAEISRKRFGGLSETLPVLDRLIRASHIEAEGNAFYGMNIAQLVYVALMGKEIRVDHTPIIKEGEIAADNDYSVYVLLDGKFVISGESVREDVVITEPGVIVGELAVEGDEGRTADVEATAWLLELDGHSYMAIRERLAPFDGMVQNIIEARQKENQQAVEQRLKEMRQEIDRLKAFAKDDADEYGGPCNLKQLRNLITQAAKRLYDGTPECLRTFEFMMEKRRYRKDGTSLHLANGPSLFGLAEAYFGQQVWLSDIAYKELDFPNRMARLLNIEDRVGNAVADIRGLDVASDSAERPLPQQVDHITMIDLFGGLEYVRSLPHGQAYYNASLTPALYDPEYIRELKSKVLVEAGEFAREVCGIVLDRIADGGDIIMTVDSPRSSISVGVESILMDIARERGITLEFDQGHEYTQHDSKLVYIKVAKFDQAEPAKAARGKAMAGPSTEPTFQHLVAMPTKGYQRKRDYNLKLYPQLIYRLPNGEEALFRNITVVEQGDERIAYGFSEGGGLYMLNIRISDAKEAEIVAARDVEEITASLGMPPMYTQLFSGFLFEISFRLLPLLLTETPRARPEYFMFTVEEYDYTNHVELIVNGEWHVGLFRGNELYALDMRLPGSQAKGEKLTSRQELLETMAQQLTGRLPDEDIALILHEASSDSARGPAESEHWFLARLLLNLPERFKRIDPAWSKDTLHAYVERRCVEVGGERKRRFSQPSMKTETVLVPTLEELEGKKAISKRVDVSEAFSMLMPWLEMADDNSKPLDEIFSQAAKMLKALAKIRQDADINFALNALSGVFKQASQLKQKDDREKFWECITKTILSTDNYYNERNKNIARLVEIILVKEEEFDGIQEARYVDNEGKVIIAFNEGFWRGHLENAEHHTEASRHLIAERILHGLGHDNEAKDQEGEQQEEVGLMQNVDMPLYELFCYEERPLQAKIGNYRKWTKSQDAPATLFNSGRFKVIKEAISAKRAGVSDENIAEYILRPHVDEYYSFPAPAKAMAADTKNGKGSSFVGMPAPERQKTVNELGISRRSP